MKFRRQKIDDVQINLTPLIDVVFLLLIFFMVSTTFNQSTELTIDLPTATSNALVLIVLKMSNWSLLRMVSMLSMAKHLLMRK